MTTPTNPTSPAEVLRVFNEWRRGEDEWADMTFADLPFTAGEIGLAIDAAIEALSAPPPSVSPRAGEVIRGTLVRAGSMQMGGEPSTGLFIELTREELAAIKHLPMYQRVTVARTGTPGTKGGA